MSHTFTKCFLSVHYGYCQHKAEVPVVMPEKLPWEGEPTLRTVPVSCVGTFLEMWCVAMEMTLAIHVSNDLKQFTSIKTRSILR